MISHCPGDTQQDHDQDEGGDFAGDTDFIDWEGDFAGDTDFIDWEGTLLGHRLYRLREDFAGYTNFIDWERVLCWDT